MIEIRFGKRSPRSSGISQPLKQRRRVKGRPSVTFAVLAVSATIFSLLQSLIVPVLSTLRIEYNTSQTTVTWVVTGYLLSASICTPIVGRIGDVVGKTRMLVIALLTLSVGSLAAALAPSIGWLIAARVLQGAGGGVLPLSFGIIRDEFRKGMTLAISVIASITALGVGLGIVLAGPIVDGIGLDALFWLPMIATLVTAVAALVFIPESPTRTFVRLPVLPALLLAGGLVALLLALSEGNDWGWTSIRTLGLFVLAALLLTSWIVVEQRVPIPMVDMKLMRHRGVWTANAVAGAVGFALYASNSFTPQLLQTPRENGYGFGASISESGWLILPSTMATFLVGFTTAALIRRVGARGLVTAGLTLAGAALMSIAFFHDHTWQLYAATIVQGLGVGLVLSSLAGIVVTASPPDQTGVASGMNNNIRTIGGSIGAAVTASIITTNLGARGYPVERGYEIGYVVLGAVLLLATVFALCIPHSRTPGSGATPSEAVADASGMVPAVIAGASRA